MRASSPSLSPSPKSSLIFAIVLKSLRSKPLAGRLISNRCHHGDGRFAIWCAAAAGMQERLVDADAERFFRPPYVGHRGWLGVRLDRGLDWDELTGIAEDAYAEVAPSKLVEMARLPD